MFFPISTLSFAIFASLREKASVLSHYPSLITHHYFTSLREVKAFPLARLLHSLKSCLPYRHRQAQRSRRGTSQHHPCSWFVPHFAFSGPVFRCFLCMPAKYGDRQASAARRETHLVNLSLGYLASTVRNHNSVPLRESWRFTLSL